jgi:hypothetical protein
LIQPPGWSHDGSTKTVRQLRKELNAHKHLHKDCKRNCSECPVMKKKFEIELN